MIQKDIQSLMTKHDLSLEDIASKIGVTAMTVYRWEKGQSQPKSRFVKKAIESLKQEYRSQT